MSNGIARFEKFWRAMDLTPRDIYVHPADALAIGPSTHTQFRLQELPIPVLGNLRSAEAVILTLNAGYGDHDAAWRNAWPDEHEAMTRAQRANILQEHSPADWPFYDWSPLFQTHPGVAYWKGDAVLAVKQRQLAKLRGVALELERSWSLPRQEIHRYIAHKVAVLEWCPYRSKEFKRAGNLENIASLTEARELACNLIQENEKLVIVTRHIDAWGFSGSQDSRENLVVYDTRQGTAASLSPHSAGGEALLSRLLRVGPGL